VSILERDEFGNYGEVPIDARVAESKFVICVDVHFAMGGFKRKKPLDHREVISRARHLECQFVICVDVYFAMGRFEGEEMIGSAGISFLAREPEGVVIEEMDVDFTATFLN